MRKNTKVSKNRNLNQEALMQAFESEHTHYDAFFKQENRQVIKYVNEFTIKLQKTFVGLYTCKVRIQQQEFSFLLDTGAQISGIMSSHVDTLNMNLLEGDLHIGSVGGSQKAAQVYCVPQMFFGAI